MQPTQTTHTTKIEETKGKPQCSWRCSCGRIGGDYPNSARAQLGAGLHRAMAAMD